MYYLAITFIFIGLGCLLYLFVVRNFQGRQDSDIAEQGPGSHAGYGSASGQPAIQQSELEEFGFGETDTSSFPLEQNSREESSARYGHLSSASASQSMHTGRSPGTTRTRVDSLWSRSVPGPGMQRQGQARSTFEGVLFLDESGQAVSAAEHWQQVSPDLFSKLKRMGPCQMQYSDRTFLIHSDSIRLQYRVDDLTRILFLDSGFAFIPEHGGPSPLILTREVDRFKNFLRDNSL
ncbi:MAG: hypothetical protein CMF59_16475 [Leptospiraceae bacterium]|nr:hypothetical protein [Leptospiraceae bacterium]